MIFGHAPYAGKLALSLVLFGLTVWLAVSYTRQEPERFSETKLWLWTTILLLAFILMVVSIIGSFAPCMGDELDF